jgi:O-acetyl-ADP-ribose deacetylase (regulator of RNase III)
MLILVGDILKSKAQTLINTVNCVGIMGKGIALCCSMHHRSRVK